MVVMALDLLHCNWMARRDARLEMVDWHGLLHPSNRTSQLLRVETHPSSEHLRS